MGPPYGARTRCDHAVLSRASSTCSPGTHGSGGAMLWSLASGWLMYAGGTAPALLFHPVTAVETV